MVAIKMMYRGEALDHELNRIPVSKSLHDQVKRAASDAGVPVTVWIRQALEAALKRQAKAS